MESALDVVGEGMDLVLVHGFCENKRMWEPILPFLSDECRVWQIDLPGFGKLSNSDALSMKDNAYFLKSQLEPFIEKPFLLVGHSMGGYVSLEYLELFPDDLVGLCLLNSHADADSPEKSLNRKKTIAFLKRNGKEEFLHLFVKDLLSQKNDGRADWLTELYEMVNMTPTKSIIGALEHMMTRTEKLSLLSVSNKPIQFLIGTEDKMYPHSTILDQAAKARNADVQLFPSGHLGIKEMPKAYARALKDFYQYAYSLSSFGVS
jgi:pimeloyl-ACP methyl ester carboxylesterase